MPIKTDNRYFYAAVDLQVAINRAQHLIKNLEEIGSPLSIDAMAACITDIASAITKTAMANVMFERETCAQIYGILTGDQ